MTPETDRGACPRHGEPILTTSRLDHTPHVRPEAAQPAAIAPMVRFGRLPPTIRCDDTGGFDPAPRGLDHGHKAIGLSLMVEALTQCLAVTAVPTHRPNGAPRLVLALIQAP